MALNLGESLKARLQQRLDPVGTQLDMRAQDRANIAQEQTGLREQLRGEQRQLDVRALQAIDPANPQVGPPSAPLEQQGRAQQIQSLADLAQASPGIQSQAQLTPMQEEQLRIQKEQVKFQRQGVMLQRNATSMAALQATVKDQNTLINSMGDDIRTTMKPVTEIIQAGADIENLLASGTVLGGTAAAIRFAKASDPDSSVREGELGTIISNLGGVEQAFVNAWNKAINEGLTEETSKALNLTTKALISQRALDGLMQLEGFKELGSYAQVPDSQIMAIFKTARVNLPEMIKYAIPAMNEQQLLQWKAYLEQQ